MDGFITDADALQACVGKLPGPRDLKVIGFLDTHALRWLSHSSLGFVAFGDTTGLRATIAGGTAGFAQGDEHNLRIPLALLDQPSLAREGAAFASLFLVPGLGETLRINGRVTAVDPGQVTVEVRECYLHCAKALIRSDFWSATPLALDDDASIPADTWPAQARFMVVATMDAQGRADLSPKGDPAGMLLQSHGGALWYPDRPGNRRVDSFRNLLQQPRIALLAMVPGSLRVLSLAGSARIATDEGVRHAFSVGDRIPNLVTRVDVDADAPTVERSAALERATPWPAAPAPTDIEPAAIFRDHVKLSASRGAAATLVRAAVSVPGLMRKGLDKDYKQNLY